jgi:hypothetical protein
MEGSVPRSVVLDVVLLDLLDVVVRLWAVHSFGAGSVSEGLDVGVRGRTISMRSLAGGREAGGR